MSSFKKLNKADVTSVSYYANKQWNLTYTGTVNDGYAVGSIGKNEVFNIGSGYRITNNQLIAKVGEVIGNTPKYEYVKDRLGHDRMYGLHCEKYIEKFGPITTITLEAWLKKMLS